MKRIILTILVIVPLFAGAQTGLIRHKGGVISFQTGLISTNIWSAEMVSSYLEINSHFSDAYKAEVEDYLLTIFSDSYVMPDASDNWYTMYADSSTADWFHVLNFYGNITSRTNAKTGDDYIWQLENSIYEQVDIPTHTYIGDNFGVVAVSDGWDGVTQYSININPVEGNLSTYNLPNCENFYINVDSIEGTLPDNKLPSLVNYYIFRNGNLDSIAYYENSQYISAIKSVMNPDLAELRFRNNDFSATDLDKLLEQMAIYYASTPPTTGMTVTIHNNIAPTCGDYNSDIMRLDSIYNDAGQVLSITKDVGNTGSLKQRPRLSMSDTIYISANDSITLFDDAIIAKSIGEYAVNLEYECLIGSRSYYGWNFNEVESDTGYYQMIVTAKECNTTVDDDTCIVRLMGDGYGSGSINILNIGNSLTYLAGEDYTDYIRTNLTGVTATMVGTQGENTWHHEGRPGWKYTNFLDSTATKVSPFWANGKIDFSTYRTDTLGLGSPIDIVTIMLGINDVFSDFVDTNAVQSRIIDSVKSLVDYILADGTESVVICLPSNSENTSDGWYANYISQGIDDDQNYFIEKIQAFREQINIVFAGKRYANNVYVSDNGYFVDRNNSYSKNSDGLHNNAVHPNTEQGYNELANPLIYTIEAILKDE